MRREAECRRIFHDNDDFSSPLSMTMSPLIPQASSITIMRNVLHTCRGNVAAGPAFYVRNEHLLKGNSRHNQADTLYDEYSVKYMWNICHQRQEHPDTLLERTLLCLFKIKQIPKFDCTYSHSTLYKASESCSCRSSKLNAGVGGGIEAGSNYC